MSVRVRFAPSPTGHLHIGNLRAAIFNWLFARHHGGKFLLRIEDTDIARSKQEYVDSILASLEWLTLTADEKPVFQMERLFEHKEAVKKLLEQGKAYPCFCEPKEISEVGFKYPGTCRNLQYSKDDLTKPHAIRFRLPENKSVTFKDLIRGKITVDLDQLDDFVIVRREGVPIYNFVVVIDDIYMQITHIIRGEDHIPNTPKQILLYEAFGKIPPIFAHLPLILGKSGAPLSKRDAATSVTIYKEEGYLPDALFNYLVRLGWAYGDQEVFSKEELVKLFNLEKVGKKGAVFDTKKLQWLNGVYIRELTLTSFLTTIDSNLAKRLDESWQEKLEIVFKLYQERAKSVVELANDILALNEVPLSLDITLIDKWHTKQTHLLIQDFIERLEILEHMSYEELSNIAKSISEEYGAHIIELAQTIRLALCGKVQSPGIFEMIMLLGREKTILRLTNVLECLRASEILMISKEDL